LSDLTLGYSQYRRGLVMRRFLAFFVVFGLALGCSHGEESECSKYVSLLSGDNPRAVFEQISEKKCQDAVPILKEMFDPKQGKYNKEIVRVVSEIWDPSAKQYKVEAEKFGKKKALYTDILRLALQSPDTAVVAASKISEWKLTDLKEDLATTLREDLKSTQPQYGPAYNPALQALTSETMGGFQSAHEDIYLALLNSSPDIQGIEVNKLAAQALGEIGSQNPEAIKALIRGIFLVSKDGGTVFKEALHSLLQIGPATAPFLIAVVESQPGDEAVRYMEEFAVKNAISEWKWRKGMRIPMVLAQLRDLRAAKAMVEDIARPVIEPPNLPDNLRQDWTIAQTNRIKFNSWGIMSVANPDVMRDALKIMRDRSVEGSARLQLALGLSFAFTPEGFETLLRVVHEPEIDEDNMTEEAITAWEKEQEELGEPAKESDFMIRYLQPLAYAVGPKDLDKWNEVFVDGFDEYFGEQERVEDIQEKMEQVDIKVLIGVVEACQNNLECYESVFQGGPGRIEGNEATYVPDDVKGIDDRETAYVQAMARAKAGLVLSRWPMGKKKALATMEMLAKAFSALDYDDELFGDLRQVMLLAFERIGVIDPKGSVAILTELMAKEEKKGVEPVKVWNQRLDALIFYISNYKAPSKAEAKVEPAKEAAEAPEAKVEEKAAAEAAK
jgi:hypothetical protein